MRVPVWLSSGATNLNGGDDDDDEEEEEEEEEEDIGDDRQDPESAWAQCRRLCRDERHRSRSGRPHGRRLRG